MKNTTRAYGTWYRTVSYVSVSDLKLDQNSIGGYLIPVVLKLIKNKNKFFPQFWAARHNKNLILCLDLAQGPDLHHNLIIFRNHTNDR
jgi:hypothetical protein